MRNLAPDIIRQRLLIEGFYTVELDAAAVKRYLEGLVAALELRSYGQVVVHAPGGAGKAGNEGFDAFLPLIDSGISLYVWTRRRFFAAVIFTCKSFSEQTALDYTRAFFAAASIEHRSF